MKVACFTALLALVAAPVVAQTAPATTTPPADAAPGAAATTGAKFSLDTPIETIAADPAGKTVLDAVFPGMTAHPAYDQFKAMSLTQVQPMANGQITDEQLAKAKADLAAIK